MPPPRTLPDAISDSLAEQTRGELIEPTDERYDEARSVWNAKIDTYPGAILTCTGSADVIAAVDIATDHELPITVKSGGHGINGHAICDDGIVLDMTEMNAVRVDPEERTAWVQGGATWGDLNHETHAFGLDTVGMSDPEVGVAGFTLGGGMGALSRKHGLAIDLLREVDVVTADGELVHASEDHHPDLFWALRGGAGNFGIVTGFEFDCKPVETEFLQALFVHPIDAAREVIQFYQDFASDAPPEIYAGVGITQISSDSPLPDELHDETVALLLTNYLGDVETGQEVIEPARSFGDPLLEMVRPTGMEAMATDLLDSGLRNHWVNQYLVDLSDEAIEAFVERAIPLPCPGTVVNFIALGGAINRIDASATAYPHREANHLFELVTQWREPSRDEELVTWAREFRDAMAQYGTGGEYVNNQTDDGPDRVEAAYGANYDRLIEVKETWDSDNLFGRHFEVAEGS